MFVYVLDGKKRERGRGGVYLEKDGGLGSWLPQSPKKKKNPPYFAVRMAPHSINQMATPPIFLDSSKTPPHTQKKRRGRKFGSKLSIFPTLLPFLLCYCYTCLNGVLSLTQPYSILQRKSFLCLSFLFEEGKKILTPPSFEPPLTVCYPPPHTLFKNFKPSLSLAQRKEGCSIKIRCEIYAMARRRRRFILSFT